MTTENRIQTEQAAIAAAQKAITTFEAERRDALIGSDEKTIDRIEDDLARARSNLSRSTDRLERLKEQHLLEQQEAHLASLDKLVSEAKRVRDAGERLIIETYGPAAATISDVLIKLSAIDDYLYGINRTLTDSGRPGIEGPNRVRSRPASSVVRREVRRIGVGDPRHPLHAVHQIGFNGDCTHKVTGELIERFGEFEIDVEDYTPAQMPDKLFVAVRLPGTNPDGVSDYWPTLKPNDTQAVIAGLLSGKRS